MNQAEHDLLVIDAQDGSRRALDALVRHHHRNLLRFAYSLCRDTALAQDAVQDAWIKVAGRLRRLDDPRAFRGWIYHAVRWRVFDLLKRSHRDDRSLEDVDAESETAVAERDRDSRIDLGAAIAGLPGNRSRNPAAVLRQRPDRSRDCRGSEHSIGHRQVTLHRARNQLRQHFEGENDEHR